MGSSRQSNTSRRRPPQPVTRALPAQDAHKEWQEAVPLVAISTQAKQKHLPCLKLRVCVLSTKAVHRTKGRKNKKNESVRATCALMTPLWFISHRRKWRALSKLHLLPGTSASPPFPAKHPSFQALLALHLVTSCLLRVTAGAEGQKKGTPQCMENLDSSRVTSVAFFLLSRLEENIWPP